MGKKNRKLHRIDREIVQSANDEKSKNKRIVILCAIFLMITGIILVFTTNSKNEKYPYKPDNIDIYVTTNDGGAQEPNAGVQKDVMTNVGAATVDDITGDTGNPANQGQGIDEMLKDKEIDVQK